MIFHLEFHFRPDNHMICKMVGAFESFLTHQPKPNSSVWNILHHIEEKCEYKGVMDSLSLSLWKHADFWQHAKSLGKRLNSSLKRYIHSIKIQMHDTKLHVGRPCGFETVLCTLKENRNVAHCCNRELKSDEIIIAIKETTHYQSFINTLFDVFFNFSLCQAS